MHVHRPPVIVARQSPPFEFIHTGNDQRDHQPAEQNSIEVMSYTQSQPGCLNACLAISHQSFAISVTCHCKVASFLPSSNRPEMLKKSNMDPDIASSYRPISNLPYISKLVERVVTRRFTAHCSAFNHLPTHHSAYRPFHSTERALL